MQTSALLHIATSVALGAAVLDMDIAVRQRLQRFVPREMAVHAVLYSERVGRE